MSAASRGEDEKVDFTDGYLIVLSVNASSRLPNLRFSLPSALHGEGKMSAASRGEDDCPAIGLFGLARIHG